MTMMGGELEMNTSSRSEMKYMVFVQPELMGLANCSGFAMM